MVYLLSSIHCTSFPQFGPDGVVVYVVEYYFNIIYINILILNNYRLFYVSAAAGHCRHEH